MQYPSYNRRSEQQLTLSDFSGGIDAAVADTALAANQLRDAQNVWWKDGVLQTRPGLVAGETLSYGLPGVILYAVDPTLSFHQGASGRLEFFIHQTTAGDGYALSVFFCRLDGKIIPIRKQTKIADWTEAPTQLLPISDGDGFGLIYVDAVPYRLMANGTLTAVTPYIPTIVVAARGSADKATARDMTAPPGTSYEPFNRLTDAFRVQYILTEGRPYFTLPAACRHCPGTLELVLNGYAQRKYIAVSEDGMDDVLTLEFAGYCVAWSTYLGVFWFTESGQVTVPDPDAWSSLHVTFYPHVDQPAARETIRAMRMATWFGGSLSGIDGGTRCFLAGSADEPGLLCYSGVQDATYFPENNDVYVGQPGQAITALRKQADMLVIFKEHEIWYSTYQTGVTDQTSLSTALEEGSIVDLEAALATFPLANISSDIGCDRPDTIALCDNRLVWTNSDARVYVLVSGNIYSERNVRSIGEAIRPLLLQRDLSSMMAADYDDHYCLQVGTEVFLFDYNAAALASISASTSNETLRKKIAWYRWEYPLATPPIGLLAAGRQMMLTTYDPDTDRLQTYRLSGTEDIPDGQTLPIKILVRWPTFIAGRAGQTQSVRSVWLDTGLAHTTLTVLPIADRDDSERHSRRILTDAAGLARFLAGIRRVGTFSLQLQLEGAAILRSLTMTVLIH